MNIVLHHSQFSIQNVCFLEKRKNIIVDGTFTKITYSDENMCMNGIYLYFPFLTSLENSGGNRYTGSYSPQYDNNKYRSMVYPSYSNSRVVSKQNVDIDMNIPNNASFMSAISNLETDILSYFKSITGVNKNINYSLRNQMMTGSFHISSSPPVQSLYMNDVVFSPKAHTTEYHGETERYVLKISGIWETATAIGITYKFIRARCFFPNCRSSFPEIIKNAS